MFNFLLKEMKLKATNTIIDETESSDDETELPNDEAGFDDDEIEFSEDEAELFDDETEPSDEEDVDSETLDEEIGEEDDTGSSYEEDIELQEQHESFEKEDWSVIKEIEREQNEAKSHVSELYRGYLRAIPEEDITFLNKMNGVFVRIEDTDDDTGTEVIETFSRSIMERYSPDTVKMLLTGVYAPGMTQFDHEWHLLLPVITNPQKVVGIFNWFYATMMKRIQQMSEAGISSLDVYNRKIGKMSHLIMIIDEASILLQSPEADQLAIQNLIMNGRRLGIHLVFFSRLKSRTLFDTKTLNLLREYTVSEIRSYFDQDIHHTAIEDVDRLADAEQFKRYIARLLNDLDYTEIERITDTRRYGTDILVLRGETRFAIKCVYSSHPAGIGIVQGILGGKIHYKCDVPVVITNNWFTKDAEQLAGETGVLLWDRAKLIEMISMSQSFRLKETESDFFRNSNPKF